MSRQVAFTSIFLAEGQGKGKVSSGENEFQILEGPLIAPLTTGGDVTANQCCHPQAGVETSTLPVPMAPSKPKQLGYIIPGMKPPEMV